MKKVKREVFGLNQVGYELQQLQYDERDIERIEIINVNLYEGNKFFIIIEYKS